jgi:hypothetical protein
MRFTKIEGTSVTVGAEVISVVCRYVGVVEKEEQAEPKVEASCTSPAYAIPLAQELSK